MTDDLRRLLKEYFDYSMVNVHTCFPGSVVSYDASTRRAEIQPYMKRKMPDGSFMNFPIIPDVPVLYFGTKKYTMHLPLEVDDEVLMVVCERCTDVWRENGAVDNEDPDPRRYSLMDSFAIPGLQPQEFIGVEEEGIVIKHHTAWDGDFISHVIMDDDKIELKYKEKAKVLMEDDKIECTTDQQKVLMEKLHTYIISPNPIGFEGTKTLLGRVLQDYFDDIEKAFSQYTHIAPITWPGPIVPPSPVLQGMAQNGIKAKVMFATNKARIACAKVLKD